MTASNATVPMGAADAGSGRRCAMPWQMMLIDLTGEVVPCPYFHDGAHGATIGNTNTASIAEIWNGPGYRALRARHVSGNLDGHPCADCAAHRMHGEYPRFDIGDGFRLDGGRCYITQIPERFWREHRRRAEEIEVLEDGVPLPLGGVEHAVIRQLGRGRYSVWRGAIYLAASDDSHPGMNGRRYSVRLGEHQADLATLALDTPSADNLLQSLAEFTDGAETMQARPGKITFIETADCNIDCPSCSQNELRLNNVRHRQGTREEVLALVPQLQQLIWHGGEPFMMRGFRDFLEDYTAALNPNLAFGFMSNGTMITPAQLGHLEKFDRFNATVSIDSFVPETYARMRAGAKLDRVLTSLDGLCALQDWPKRQITVAMIIGKTNLVDLPHNLRHALDRDIRLMINPITLYPVTERLGVFSDFEAQTASWENALSACEQIGREAERADADALHGLDFTAAVAELRRIYEREKAAHADVIEVMVLVGDPHGSLSAMRRPGLMLQEQDGPSGAVAYAEVAAAGTHVLRVPRSRIPQVAKLVFYADLIESGSDHHFGDLLDLRHPCAPIRLHVPPYVPPARPRNVHYVRRQSAGLQMQARGDLHRAYVELMERERILGAGFRPVEPGAAFEQTQVAFETPQAPVANRRALGWWPPMIDFLRPYLRSGPPGAGASG